MNALIVSTTDKAYETIVQVLKLCGNFRVTKAESISQARAGCGQHRYDVAVIYAATRDVGYKDVAMILANNGTGTVFIPSWGIEDDMLQLYDYGIQLVGKPITKLTLFSALKSALGLAYRLSALIDENEKLKSKLETLRLVSKAKSILMKQGMTEEEAHKIIEQKAMETRRTRGEVASDIIERNE